MRVSRFRVKILRLSVGVTILDSGAECRVG